MNIKIIISIIIIVGALIFGATSFMETNIEYTNFTHAEKVQKKVQVKGEWVKEKESKFETQQNQFIFYMKDENNQEMKIILDGAKPNNFEIATSIVAKGRFKEGTFYASEVLTKCPSKYEGDGQDVKKSSM